jgi:hypothetical protein
MVGAETIWRGIPQYLSTESHAIGTVSRTACGIILVEYDVKDWFLSPREMSVESIPVRGLTEGRARV